MNKENTNNQNEKGPDAGVTTPVETPHVGDETFTLPSGKTATIQAYKGKHIRQAMKIADGDTSIIPFALISLIVTVDGNKVVYEDIDEMYGPDVMKLMEKFGNFS